MNLSRVQHAVSHIFLLPLSVWDSPHEVNDYWGDTPANLAKKLDKALGKHFTTLWSFYHNKPVKYTAKVVDTPVSDKLPLIIGLHGPARSGKDTGATCLCNYKPGQRLFFAEGLKGACQILFDLTDEQTWSDKKEIKEAPIPAFQLLGNWSPRRIFQVFGTEVGRQGLRDDVWIKCVDKKARMSGSLLVYITDVRFDNEADYVRTNNGILFIIDAPYALSISAVGHASEAGITRKPSDKVVHNPFRKEDIENPVKCQQYMDEYTQNLQSCIAAYL